MKTREELEAIATVIVDSMLAVHRELGPGLLESTYQACLAHELRTRGKEVRCELKLPVKYKGIEIEAGYRLDLLVDECILVENKSCKQSCPFIKLKRLPTRKCRASNSVSSSIGTSHGSSMASNGS